MANQLDQLARLLREDGVEVEVVPVNAPYRPTWIGRWPGVRAVARLVPYAAALRRAAGRADILHVFANSGWSWHLFAAPAVWIGRARGKPVVVNYRGGGADAFLETSARWVRPTIRRASALVVPSGFLMEVFARHGLEARIVPNIVDTVRFAPAPRREPAAAGPRILVARNLEPVYDVATGLRAFQLVRRTFPAASLTIAGSGPEGAALKSLAAELGVAEAVRFAGRVENEKMPGLYREADVVLNPSLVDNMPISILEALACGVPVVSTDVGGVRHLVRHGETARLVPAGDAGAMAAEMVRLRNERGLAERQVEAGRALAESYTWPRVREALADVYRAAIAADRSR
jgi:glycosyltransferase involved in cell wall biosynthesis